MSAWSAREVAHCLARIAAEHGKTMNAMGLNKLTYVAHGLHLAERGKPLIDEPIDAWKYGPVIPTLYHVTKQFGPVEIGPEKLATGGSRGASSEVEEFLRSVFDRYGHLSDLELSDLAHEGNSPWGRHYTPGRMGIRIPDSEIAEHLSSLERDRQGTQNVAA